MATETEEALQELYEFLEAQDIDHDKEGGNGALIKGIIAAYNASDKDLATALDEVDSRGLKLDEIEAEMSGLLGQHDAARSLWNKILNLCSEFKIPATKRPELDCIDMAGCEKVVDSMAEIVRAAIKAGPELTRIVLEN